MSATRKTKPTLEGFRDFCASKPADERYSYLSADDCAVAQYHAAIGAPYDVHASSDDPDAPYERVAEWCAAKRPWFFSALTDRLTARLRSQVAK